MPTYPSSPWLYFLNTVIFGLIVWLIQKGVSTSADRKLADFKGLIDQQLLSYKNLYDQQLLEYKTQFDHQIEQYKAELKYLNDKLLVLHSRRLDVVKETNDKLVKLNSAMMRLVAIRPVHQNEQKENEIKESILNDAHETYAEYNNFILFNKIYFPEKFAEQLESIRQQYFSAHWDLFGPERLQSIGLGKGAAYRQSGQVVIDASNRIREEIPKILSEIEKEFRIMLGVE